MMTAMSANSRPVALVTAPFRGEGLETLRDLADVVLDPWISADTMRMYNAEQLAERVRGEGATILVCETDVCAGPVMELPLIAIGSTRGDPTNVDIPAATAAGIPVLRAPGRNADAVAEIAVALLFAATRHVVPADHDVRAGDVWKDGTIPYQRYRAWQLAGQHGRPRRPGRGRARAALAARGPGHEGHRPRPLRRRRQAVARRGARVRRRDLAARGGHARDRRG